MSTIHQERSNLMTQCSHVDDVPYSRPGCPITWESHRCPCEASPGSSYCTQHLLFAIRPEQITHQKSPHRAIWSIQLNCICPACQKDVNLLDDADFWDGRQLKVAETGTEHSDNLEVKCPMCGNEFNVDCEY